MSIAMWQFCCNSGDRQLIQLLSCSLLFGNLVWLYLDVIGQHGGKVWKLQDRVKQTQMRLSTICQQNHTFFFYTYDFYIIFISDV